MIRVMANGCFDCLHIGHVMHLDYAATFGDRLIVALTEDDYVNKGPGRPVFSWEERAQMLRSLRCVDDVIPCKYGVYAMTEVKPDIYVKGYEYKDKDIDERNLAVSLGVRIVFLDTPTYSSTKILSGELLRERIAASGHGGR